MINFILIGPNKGATGEWGGFKFKDGVCAVNDHDAGATARLLEGYYSAFPEDMAEAKQREYEQVQGLAALDRAKQALEDATAAADAAAAAKDALEAAAEEAARVEEAGAVGGKKKKGKE